MPESSRLDPISLLACKTSSPRLTSGGSYLKARGTSSTKDLVDPEDDLRSLSVENVWCFLLFGGFDEVEVVFEAR